MCNIMQLLLEKHRYSSRVMHEYFNLVIDGSLMNGSDFHRDFHRNHKVNDHRIATSISEDRPMNGV